MNKKVCSMECRNKLISNNNIKDISGIRFGKLVVVGNSGRKTNSGNVIWECQCDCGNITYVGGGDLSRANGTKSCGCIRNNNIYEKHKEGYIIGKGNNGKIFIFDECDFDLIKQYTWNIDNKGYAMATSNGKKIALHRLILNITDKKIQVDHINKDRFDNRRDNLRICTAQENLWNKNKMSDKKYTSKYIGVSWHIRRNQWRANIRDENGKIKSLGGYNNEVDAAKAYDKACLKYHGEFAVLNFPEDYAI